MANMVKMGCKLPHGLIMELGIKMSDQGQTITRDEKYKAVTLKGTKSQFVPGTPAQASEPPAITLVDAEFAQTWLKNNAQLSFVKSGMVYIVKDDAEAQARAVDLASVKTGFEPLDPKKAPKGIIPGKGE